MGKMLCVAEKPSVGKDIAEALGCKEKKQGYIEGDKYIVTWAAGHLITQKKPDEHDPSLHTWSFESLPFRFDIKDSLKVIPEKKDMFFNIKKLIARDDVSEIINCGDSGREGYLIQKWIYRMAGNRKPEKVLWLDSFTRESILRGFQNLHEDYEFADLLQEAEARAEIDWIMGMNYSRGLTMRQETRNVLLSYGRCQTPLLNLIYLRDEQIAKFKPEPYFNLKAKFTAPEGSYIGTMIGQDKKNINFAVRTEAESIAAAINGKQGTVVSFKSAQQKKNAPLLFDLGTLQTEAGNRYGYTAEETLAIAQELYETHKILSYPRTDSKYLSTALLKEIDGNLNSCNFGEFAPIVGKIRNNHWVVGKEYVNDKKITDHPALTPVITNIEAEYGKLSIKEKNIFDLVVRRFLAIFFPPYIYQATEIITQVDQYFFKTNGRVPLSLGYREVFAEYKEKKDKDKEDDESTELPGVQNGEAVRTSDPNILDKMTEPPAKITVGNIVKLMEKYNIGTPATRANIIQTLLTRTYIKLEGKKYSVTPLGAALINSVPSDLKDPQLTNQIETQLQKIGDGEMSKSEFLDRSYEDIKEHIRNLEKTTIRGTAAAKAEAASLAACPLCDGPVMKINPKAKEDGTKPNPFYGCMNYKSGCKFRMPGEIPGHKFTETEVKKILPKLKNGGTSQVIKGLKGKSGKTFDAALKWDAENSRLSFVFPEKAAESDPVGECPLCGKNVTKVTPKAKEDGTKPIPFYGCSGYKEGCHFFIRSELPGHKFTDSEIKKMLPKLKNGGTSQVIKGLKGKSGKEFDAAFKWDSENNRLKFVFKDDE